MDLAGRISNAGAQPVLSLSGEIDLSTLPLLRDHLTRLVHDHPRATVRADLDGVTSLDDTGLGILLGVAAGLALEGSLHAVFGSHGEAIAAMSLVALASPFVLLWLVPETSGLPLEEIAPDLD